MLPCLSATLARQPLPPPSTPTKNWLADRLSSRSILETHLSRSATPWFRFDPIRLEPYPGLGVKGAMGTPGNNVRTAILADRIFDGRRWHWRSAALVEGRRLLSLVPWDSVPGDCSQHHLPEGTFLGPGF